MKRGGIFVLALILAIFLISQVSADFAKGNLSYSLGKSYNLGDPITGWINISLTNEPTNSILKDSFGESINLIDLIENASNSNFAYMCSPASCASDYLIGNEQTSKTIALDENDSAIIGFNLTSLSDPSNFLSDITKFTFDLQSNNPETEKLPISIDILDDGSVEWQAYAPSGNFATSENLGCWGLTGGQANLAKSPSQYCEKIKLTKAAAVEIGAYVNGSGNANFNMIISRADNPADSANCLAKVSGSNPRIACVPSFSIKSDGNYFVCIKPSTDADANMGYTLAYNTINPCGFSGTYNHLFNYNFEIFAKQEKYAAGINFTMNDAELKNSKSYLTASSNIEKYLKTYISQRYNNNCSRGCIIPVKISSGISQQINITNLDIQYAAGVSLDTYSIFDVAETAATITSKFQKLDFRYMGFHAPIDYGNFTFSVSLDNQSLFSDKIVVVAALDMIKALTPLTTGEKYPTTFQLIPNDNQNITKYIWDFGNGDIQTTYTNSATYTYNQSGTYSLIATVTNSLGQNSSKTFGVNVQPASEIVPTLLAEEQANVANLKSQLAANFSQFEQKGINKSFNLAQIDKTLTSLDNSLSSSSSDAQFENALGQLLNMKIPDSIERTVYSNGIIFYPQVDNINLDALSSITHGNYTSGKESEYQNAIFAWNNVNTNILLNYNEISSIYPTYEQSLLRTFDVNVANTGSDNAYIVIKNMKDLSFEEDYSQKQIGNYYYIPIGKEQKEIVFSTTDNVDFVDLPMFVSPAIDSLSLAEWSPFTEGGQLKKWVLFAIVAIIIILIVLIIWIILQIWYKRKYEKHLFKDRNNLYNLITYIANEKKKETEEKEMVAKLKKSGWTSEQITYALKKYKGKRTGMAEIPIEKIFKENKNTKQ